MKTILFYITIFVLLMAACAPLVPAPATPTPVVTEEIPVTGSVAVVQSVEIEILESQPLQANAVIRGQLPDAGCTTIRSVEQVRDGNTIRLSLVTTTDPLALCAPALTPFEQVVPLDVAGLPPATYTVEVGGVEQEFELLTRDLSSFQQVLVDALNARDYELLKALMDDSFVIGYWQSEGTSNTPEAAIDLLRSSFLSGSSTVTADPTKNLIELLGMDPVTIIGPEATEASPLFVSGLGPEGKDEAILFTAKLPDGSLYWYGMLFARDGFAQLVPIQPVDTNAYQTSVQYIIAQRDVALFNGPGNNFGVIGIIYGGQIARVTGTNVNASWWRVVCSDNTVGACWVSADPSLTQTTTVPHNNQPPPDTGAVPTISIIAVVKDDIVTIRTSNYPANTIFDVRMGKMGTKGIDGILVDRIDSKKGGSFTATFEIPERLHGQDEIAIRLQSKNGYFSYNWFSNVTYGTTPGQHDHRPTSVKYVMAMDTIVIRKGPGSEYPAIGSVDKWQIVKVTGISLDENWWRVICPDGTTGSCWLSANPNSTEPSDGPASEPVQPTNVKYVMALQDLSIHNGPGKQYNVIGSVAAGQVAKVTGINLKGNWWRVMCPDDTVGSCWISAKPENTKPTDLTGNADVQNVEIRILESQPVQVNAIARGQLPDAGCTTIAGASQVRNGNTFTVKVTTKTDPLALCALMLTPFEHVISLDVSSLLPGRYIVNVNGVEESFELPGAGN